MRQGLARARTWGAVSAFHFWSWAHWSTGSGFVSVTVNQHTSEDSGHVRNLTLGPRLFTVEAEFITLVLI